MPVRGTARRNTAWSRDNEPGRHRRHNSNPFLLALALLAAFAMPAGGASARAAVDPVFGVAPLADGELAALSGGFSVGGFDISVGIVARSIVEQALGGLGERLEVVTRFTVPQIGRLANQGTTVRTLGSADAAATASGAMDQAPTSGFSVSAGKGATLVDLGTTRLTRHMLNTFVENSDLNRVINNQLDINLEIGGFARHLSALRSAKALRPAVDAQIAYGNR